MWVIVANGIAGGTSYANEDEAIELCDQLNEAFETGRATMAETLEAVRQVATGEIQVGNNDTDGLDWIAKRIAVANPPDFSCGDCDPCLGGRPDQCAVMAGQPNAEVSDPAR